MSKKSRNRNRFHARMSTTPRPAPGISPWQPFVDEASESDRTWFEAHPDAQQRIRDYQIGEFLDQVPPKDYKVLVRQLQPGVRYRSAIAPDLVERIEVGECFDLPLEPILRDALEAVIEY